MASSVDARCEVSGGGVLDGTTWDDGRVITVTVPENNLIDPDVPCRIAHRVTSADPAYSTLGSVPSVQVEVINNDVVNLVYEPASLTVPEGGQASFTVRLTAQPIAAVVLNPTPSADCEVTPAAALNAQNWQVGVSVNVVGQEDERVTGDRVCEVGFSLSSTNDAFTVAADALPGLSVTVTENDAAGLILNTDRLNVAEGEAATYTARLTAQPSAPVSLAPIPDQPGCEAQAEGLLTAENWDVGVAVTVTALDDRLAGGDRACVIQHALASEAAAFNLGVGALPRLTLNIADNDTPGVVIGARTVTQTEGRSNEYQVALESQPIAPVQLSVSSDAALCRLELDGTLTPETWETGVTVTVSSADDGIVQGTRSCRLTHTLRSTDPAYDLGADQLPAVEVRVEDNDTLGVVISAGELRLVEGETVGYRVTLGSEPAAPVALNVLTSDARCQVSAETLLDAENYDEGILVEVSVADDTVALGSFACTLTHQLTSDDANYTLGPNALPGVVVQVDDDDSPGLALGETTLRLTEGTTGAFSLVLNSQPQAPVTVSASTESEACTLSLSANTLDENTWQEGVTLTVSVADTPFAEGERECIIRYTLSSDDANYTLDGAALAQTVVTVVDDEQPA
ncbi:MAG: hypothetical protein HC915_21345 [Anaerolineae bacterium]|nr:hypothetical protein [Anaerolineae bacterium]